MAKNLHEELQVWQLFSNQLVSEISGTSQRESQKIQIASKESFFFLSYQLFDFQFDSQYAKSNRKFRNGKT